MDLREYAAALRKHWYLVALLVILGTLWGLYEGKARPTQYRASSQVFVSVAGGSNVTDLVQGSTYTQNLVQSYAQLATMPAVLNPVIDQLGLETSAKSLSHAVTADNPLDTVIIQITATTGTPQTAADLSNAVANQLKTTIAQLSPSAGNRDSVRVSVVAPASKPSFPIAPNKKRLLMLGFGLGFALGILAAVLRQLFDTRIRTADDIEQLTSAPIIGSVPQLSRRRKHRRAVTAIAPTSAASESYRRLQTNLQFLHASSRLQCVVVTSSLGGEGKTATAINLALAVAEKGMSVLLVDADMRRPSIADYCNLESSAGLTTVLIGKADLASVVQQWGPASLDVLTVGEMPPNPSQLIGSTPMTALLDEAAHRYDLVILDAPPLLPVADAAVLARVTDGAVVVANCQQLHRSHLLEALATLETVDARCLGIVANRMRVRAAHSYYGRPTRLLDRFVRLSGRRRASAPPLRIQQAQARARATVQQGAGGQ